MNRKLVLATALTLVLIGMLSVTIKVQRVKASATISINADGSITPPDAPISSSDNVTYTFTDDINDFIRVYRDDIVVDGAGYTVQGTGSGTGIDLTSRNNVTIKNMEIKAFYFGIWLHHSQDNTIYGNTITANDIEGIRLFEDTQHNNIHGNNITNNGYGIYLEGYSNFIYHNNFVNNTEQVHIAISNTNVWDDGVEGNYWSNYTGVDSDYDGIGDSEHVIDGNNKDNFPLMGMFSDFLVTHQEETYHVTTICSSIISEFQFNDVNKTISFNVTGPDYTLGFCRVTIPNIIVQDLWQDNPTVLVDGEEPIMMNNWTDGTYTYVYFKYVHSEHEVLITPEFPAFTSTLLILILLTIAITIHKRRLLKTPTH